MTVRLGEAVSAACAHDNGRPGVCDGAASSGRSQADLRRTRGHLHRAHPMSAIWSATVTGSTLAHAVLLLRQTPGVSGPSSYS